MTDVEIIVWGTLATLLGTLVVAVITWLIRKRSDQVLLKGNMIATADINIMNAIGCAGLVLTVVSKSKRVAKIAESYISLIADHEIIESLAKGFNFPFGQGFSPDLPSPMLIVKLIPLSKSTINGACVLERDDVCKFFLPILLPFINKFTNAPSEDVTICVKCLNGDEIVLMKGLEVQERIRDLIQIHGGLPGNLKVGLTVNLRTSTTTPPDSSGLIGKVNPNRIEFSR